MKHKKLRIALGVGLLVFLVGVGTVAGYTAYVADQVEKTAAEAHKELDRGQKSDERVKMVNPAYDETSILFIGVDGSEARERKEGGNRSALSDALVLATFNKDDTSVKLVSIPRDSYTYIPEVGYKDKITHAHAFGGVDATVETVERMFDVPVDYYVRLNFQSFVDLVNALGGIPFDVPFDLAEQNSQDVKGAITLEEGYQVLNGEEALALARSRQYDSDLARGQRQMELLQVIVDEALSPSTMGDLDTILGSISDHLTTNLTFEEMLAFKDYFLSGNELTFDTMQLDGEGMYIDGIWYFNVEEKSLISIKHQLRSHLGLTGENQFADDDDDHRT